MTKRIVDTKFWLDDKVLEQFSPEDKLFMLYLMTNPHSTQLGIYPINKKLMAFELGYSPEAIAILLDRFENKYGIIKFSSETGEIAIKNYLKYSIVKGGKPVEDLLNKEINLVKNKELLYYIFNNIYNSNNINDTICKVINEYIDDNNININVNDDSFTNRKRIVSNTKKIFIPPTLEEIQDYCKERKNKVDAKAFYDYFNEGNWKDSKGNQVKNWKQKIITWEKYNTSIPTKKETVNEMFDRMKKEGKLNARRRS